MRHYRPNSRRGSVAVQVALSVPILLTVTAMVVELGVARSARQSLQHAIDAAALGAALDLDGTEDGLMAAVASAEMLFKTNIPHGVAKVGLSADEMLVGIWDPEAELFTVADAAEANAVQLSVSRVPMQFGLAKITGLGKVDSVGGWAVAWRDEALLADEEGLPGGHFDVDTSSYLATFPGSGSTDVHIHEYDDKHDVTWYDAITPAGGSLHSVSDDVPIAQRFKILVINPHLSPRAQLVVNGETTPAVTWADTPIAALPVYSQNGAGGTIKLDSLSVAFPSDSIVGGGLIPSVTACIRNNDPGAGGEWRNGALTVQLVPVDATGADGFTTNTGLSAGGVHGVSSAVLHEITVFWHWDHGCYGSHDEDWEPAPPESGEEGLTTLGNVRLVR